jgi:hypothetical protein
VRAGEVPVDKYVITKGLNKSPNDYPDAKSQPHLQVRGDDDDGDDHHDDHGLYRHHIAVRWGSDHAVALIAVIMR